MTVDEAYIKFKDIWKISEISINPEDVFIEEDWKTTPAAPNEDSGCAFDGAILFHSILTYHFAEKIKSMLAINDVSSKSLAKICCLFQIGKIGMLVPNENTWEISKLGRIYKFNDTGVVLKTGEKSHYFATNAGIKFTLEEREAITITDKQPEEYDKSSTFISHLSRIIRMANDCAYFVERERHKNKAK